MESNQNKNNNAQESSEEHKKHIEDANEEINKQKITDPIAYIEKELSGLKLDSEQRQLLKDCAKDEK